MGMWEKRPLQEESTISFTDIEEPAGQGQQVTFPRSHSLSVWRVWIQVCLSLNTQDRQQVSTQEGWNSGLLMPDHQILLIALILLILLILICSLPEKTELLMFLFLISRLIFNIGQMYLKWKIIWCSLATLSFTFLARVKLWCPSCY